MWYHYLGMLSAALFLLTWYGLAQQWWHIEARRQAGQSATQSLSVNQFASSFFAFYANFIFGIAVEPFNHYLVWTRLGALLLLLVILFYLWFERRSYLTGTVLLVALMALLGGCVSMGFRPYPGLAKAGANIMMLVITIMLVQGTLHQWWLVRKTGVTGALSSRLFGSILIKDCSTLAFALTMPLAQAWPLLTLNGASVITRGVLYVELKRRQNN